MKISNKFRLGKEHINDISEKEWYMACVGWNYFNQQDFVNCCIECIQVEPCRLFEWALGKGYTTQSKIDKYAERVPTEFDSISEVLLGDKNYSIIRSSDKDLQEELIRQYFKAISVLIEFICTEGKDYMEKLYDFIFDIKTVIEAQEDDGMWIGDTDIMASQLLDGLYKEIDSLEDDIEEYYNYSSIKSMDIPNR